MATYSGPRQRHASDSWWHPTDYVRILYKRRWVAIPAFLLVFVSGALETIRAVPIYEARTQLLIERDSRRPTSIDAALQDPGGGYYDDGFYFTQYKIIQSRSMALRTVEALDAQGKPEKVPAPSGFSFSLTGLVGSGLSTVIGLVATRPAPAAPRADSEAEAATAVETAAQSARVGRFLAQLTVTGVRNSSLVDLRVPVARRRVRGAGRERAGQPVPTAQPGLAHPGVEGGQ